MRRASPLVPFLLLITACGAGWHRQSPEPRQAINPRQQVQVWTAGRAQRWHGLEVTGDSVSGIPFQQALSCDSCRIAMPAAAVDSIRYGNPTGGFWNAVGTSVGAMLLVYAILCCPPTT